MDFDPELLKQLVNTFKTELDEKLQGITDGLLILEKQPSKRVKNKTIETIFRFAHNIKGSAGSLNIPTVAEIAHHIEALFVAIQKGEKLISSALVDLAFEAVDKMRIAMQCFLDNKPLPFNLESFLSHLDRGIVEKKTEVSKTPIKVDTPEEKPLKRELPGTIRVSVENLDRIAALMEDLQVNTIGIEAHDSDLTQLVTAMKRFMRFLRKGAEQNFSGIWQKYQESLHQINEQMNEFHKNIHLRINELMAISHSLQDEMRMLRLIPAATLLQSLRRTVRDLAAQMNKEVDFVITGDSVKMDKMVLEGLKDPIVHLLRNAVDHGLESKKERIHQGKSEIGHIWLAVHEESNQIRICIKDDGKGLNINEIGQTALKKNLITEAELASMDESDILNLIFRPGFSTREIITAISGRGVGLNVVQENIEKLKGQVQIETKPGEYTLFNLKVPLTLATERGLILQSGGQLFVFPTSTVEKVLSISSEEINYVESGESIIVDQRPISLRTLADILNLERKEPLFNERLSVVVLKKNLQTVALLVESIIGEQEIVVKPLNPPIDNIAGIGGGTLSSTGEVMIVLDPSDLIALISKTKKITPIKLRPIKTERENKPHVLVVDDSITTRSLEKSILESKGYRVTTAVNGKEAWDFLQKQKFSLLITDVVMPIVDGFTLTARVKKTESLKEMPVIIVTSLDSEREKMRGVEVGADAYIVKSEFESGVLLQVIEQLV